MHIAVLLATYNREEKTVACLESLKKQLLPGNISYSIYLTDDASSDNTIEAVKKIFPAANIYLGNGSLYWAGGMRISWGEAIQGNADYFLLINDDTVLTETAVSELLKYYNTDNDNKITPAVCIGTTLDRDSNTISYGGRNIGPKNRIDRNYRVYSDTKFVDCDLGNANLMLVPRVIVEKIGILASCYTHGIADYDYTLRAKKAGFRAVVAPGILGYCVDDNVKPPHTKLHERIRYLKSPKGLQYNEYLKFIRAHFPTHLPIAFCKLWMRTFFPFIWNILKNNQVIQTPLTISNHSS